MIGAPNTQGQKYWVGIVQWAPETSVSEEIVDIFRNYNIDPSIGSDNGLAPSRRQTIFWSNDRILFTEAYMHHSASMS